MYSNQKTSEEDVEEKSRLSVEEKGLETHLVVGHDVTICGVIGDTTKVDPRDIEVSPSVEKVMRVEQPYKLANRAFHPEDTIVDVDGVKSRWRPYGSYCWSLFCRIRRTGNCDCEGSKSDWS